MSHLKYLLLTPLNLPKGRLLDCNLHWPETYSPAWEGLVEVKRKKTN